MGKYIVTGCAGFIGSHLTEALLAAGNEVIGIDNFSSGFKENLPKGNKNFKFYERDISDWQDLKFFKVSNVDGIFHVAGFARIQPSLDNPSLCNATNVNGTINILELAKKLKIKNVVYSASSSSYGLKAKLPCTEDQAPDCLNPYAVSKYAGELYLKAFSVCYGLNTVALKYFNVYGARSPEEGSYAPVIGLFFRQAIKDQIPLTVVGDGEQRRDFTYVKDVVVANLRAMTALLVNPEPVTGKTLNVGCGTNYTINQVADLVLKALDSKLGKVYVPSRPAEARETLADISEAKKYINWEPQYSLQMGIEEIKEYYKDKWRK